MSAGTWYTVLLFGSDAQQPPRGPWSSKDEADTSISRWHTRLGAYAQGIAASMSATLAGPYPTRARAREACIATADGVPRRRL